MLGGRLEKMVEASFVRSWSILLTSGLRPGDRWELTEGMTAHVAANTLVRLLLKSDCDTLCVIDSDGDFEQDTINKLRDHEPGLEYDALQAFYTRRGWPPQAIWFKRDEKDVLHNCLILGETTEDVALIGTHCVLIRREVFERLMGDNDPEEYDWFHYPRHKKTTEDAAFSHDALEAGFRLGATTAAKVGHVNHLSVGWETYQEYLYTSGQTEQINRYDELMRLMEKFTGEKQAEITEKMRLGNKNVLETWEKYDPKTVEDVREFYKKDDSGYLYDLLMWNCSLPYIGITRPLSSYTGKKVLVIGAGLGSEAALLAGKNDVDVFELPGILRDFCKMRLDGNVNHLEGDTLQEALKNEYDLVVAIDTIEHFHPGEFSSLMDAMGNSIKSGGEFYCHNNFGQQDLYPMHFDNAEAFSAWAKKNKLNQMSEFVWKKE